MGDFFKIRLSELLNQISKDKVEKILGAFECPYNLDVEKFLKEKAIPFAKSNLSNTVLVFYAKEKVELLGYFTIAHKMIIVDDLGRTKSRLKGKVKNKLGYLLSFDAERKFYYVSAPLIGQLGKNYNKSNEHFINGDDLLQLAIQEARIAMMATSGKLLYLECEDIAFLKEFYQRNGFQEFSQRKIDLDEKEFYKKDYLIQMLLYVSGKNH